MGDCLSSSMTIRHSPPARGASARLSSSAMSTRYTDRGETLSSAASPSDRGHGGNRREFPFQGFGLPIRQVQFDRRRHPGLDVRRHARVDPDEGLHRPTAPGQTPAPAPPVTPSTARLRPTSPRRNHGGEDGQQHRDGADQQALPRRGNCQQPVELLTFFLGLRQQCREMSRMDWLNTTVRTPPHERLRQGQRVTVAEGPASRTGFEEAGAHDQGAFVMPVFQRYVQLGEVPGTRLERLEMELVSGRIQVAAALQATCGPASLSLFFDLEQL